MSDEVIFNPLTWISSNLNEEKISILQLENTIANQILELQEEGNYVLSLDSKPENIKQLKENNIKDHMLLHPLSTDMLETEKRFSVVFIKEKSFSPETLKQIILKTFSLLSKKGSVCISFNPNENPHRLNHIFKFFEDIGKININSYYDKEQEILYLLFVN